MQTPTPPAPVAATVQAPLFQSPRAIYDGLSNQNDVLQSQMRQLVSQRSDLVSQLSDASEITGPAKTGLEERIASLDKQIAGVDQQIALSNSALSKAAATPGAVVPHVEPPRTGIPDEAFALAGIFMVIVFLPLSIAFARRIWKRSATVVSSLPADLMARIQRIEHAVETSGIEIERIGEGQRFITKLFSEKLNALPAPREEPRAP
jgi:hypothetical protein